jgi:hypothetical protein
LSAFQGAFFLMKKALSSISSVYTNSENALAAEGMQIAQITFPQGLKPLSFLRSLRHG